MAATTTRQVALLRGINVGRNKQLPMAELRELLEGLGYADVATHLRSGNAVFASGEAPDAVARRVERAISERFGFDVAVVVRDAPEIAAVLARDPFAGVATDGSRYFVAFLSGEPDAAVRERVAALAVEPELVLLEGRHAYLWCPGGVNESRAWKPFSTGAIGVTATTRNWNTVRRIAEMLDG